jgi:hypothetical protein
MGESTARGHAWGVTDPGGDVPNGIFPVPQFHTDPNPRDPMRAGLVARVRARLRRSKLDEQLARGVDPEGTELRLRAAQLRSHRGRSRLANGLVEALGDARGPNLGAFRLRTRRQHAAIREAADDLLPLVRRLRDERPIAIRGAAMAARLLNDRRSPLHRDDAEELQGALRAAHAALDAADPATRSLPAAA